MKPYADTNLFTRLYLPLPETPTAVQWLEHAQKSGAISAPITWLHRVEFVNAVQQHVFAGRTGQLRVAPEQAAIALTSFREDISREEFLQELERRLEGLSSRHTARHGFRNYDVLHVASALMLKCDVFWSFDPKAVKLAALEGLKTRH